MSRKAPFLVHVAGSPMALVQRCIACHTILTDNTGWAEGRVAVMDGDDSGPSWWPVGQKIATDKEPGSCSASMTYVVEGDELGDDEQPCVGVN